MIKSIVVVASLLAGAAHAGPDRVSILLGSQHIGADGFNEINPGIFLTWERDIFHWSAGVYYNSYSRASVAATAYLPVIEWENGNAGAFAGLALYPGNGRDFKSHIAGDVVIVGGLQARYRNLFVQITPMDGDPVDVLVAFGVTFKLGKSADLDR